MIVDEQGRDVPRELLEAIGALTVTTARLQQVLVGLCTIYFSGPSEPNRSKLDKLGIGDLTRRLRKDGPNTGSETFALLDEADELAEYRNRVVHDRWYIGDHGSPVALQQERSTRSHRPVAEVWQKAKSAEKLAHAITRSFGTEIVDAPDEIAAHELARRDIRAN